MKSSQREGCMALVDCRDVCHFFNRKMDENSYKSREILFEKGQKRHPKSAIEISCNYYVANLSIRG